MLVDGGSLGGRYRRRDPKTLSPAQTRYPSEALFLGGGTMRYVYWANMPKSSAATEDRAVRLMWAITGDNEKADTVVSFEYRGPWGNFLEDFKQLSWAFPEEEFELEEHLLDDTGRDFWRTTWTLRGGEVL